MVVGGRVVKGVKKWVGEGLRRCEGDGEVGEGFRRCEGGKRRLRWDRE